MVINSNDYKDIPYFELIEIAINEQDIEKRQALFEYSNVILETEYMSGVSENRKRRTRADFASGGKRRDRRRNAPDDILRGRPISSTP